jgi:hypothetical protein
LFRDVAALHEKLERTRNLAKENEAAKGSFQAGLAIKNPPKNPT